MRGTVPDLASPHPLLGQLPVVYADHDFLGRFLAALDEVLAPVLLTLDNLAAYLDPRTAPVDFLGWLAGWLGVDTGAGATPGTGLVPGPDSGFMPAADDPALRGVPASGQRPDSASPVAVAEPESLTRHRSAVAAAVARHRWRGTRRGLAELIRQETGLEPKIVETGGAIWSATPGYLPAIPSRAGVIVRLRPPAGEPVDRARLDRLIAAEVPAHVSCTVEILPAGEQP